MFDLIIIMRNTIMLKFAGDSLQCIYRRVSQSSNKNALDVCMNGMTFPLISWGAAKTKNNKKLKAILCDSCSYGLTNGSSRSHLRAHCPLVTMSRSGIRILTFARFVCHATRGKALMGSSSSLFETTIGT